MALASPFLEDLLTRWLTRADDMRHETEFQKELIDPLALAASGNRLAMRERRRRDLRQLEKTTQEAQTRWDERLHRIEEWKEAVSGLQQEESQSSSLIRSTLWLQKARGHQDAFTRRLDQRADLLHAEQQAVHERLTVWHALLEERAAALEDLVQKVDSADHPFYVSRARKQPELDFIHDQRAESEALGRDVQSLRRTLNHLLGRVHKAFSAVERQAAGEHLLYEVHKQEIVSALKGSEKILQEKRDAILTDALLYESGRSLSRKLHQIVHGLRCIEDAPKGSKRSWKKFLGLR